MNKFITLHTYPQKEVDSHEIVVAIDKIVAVTPRMVKSAVDPTTYCADGSLVDTGDEGNPYQVKETTCEIIATLMSE